ncbi:molybdenum cofactor guanylyltransferase [Parerythrobacter jejuensis]|uniref:Molybdenum cofactor guanylyltransferase n=1 Tax=Parerythrobacter jejuensis TaxID=795812 RepID=A0A845AU00_9SPHN|nr:molybdenum cofactor guanylyltransferase [Parerythrobacter jejuensis]MXP30229.1 NTP transferase domain-containing protein [Parerythrobacter jejuensis]MXP32989.1 NTP transferase domain-containing protein [Parerythrobacter jejuensis]
MNILGAVLAGGKARRFGSDKAYALVDGERLIDRVSAALAAQTQAVLVCGRDETGFECIADRPDTGLGPLGGLNAALHFAAGNGYNAVLSAGCDVHNLPTDLIDALAGSGPAIVQSQPVIGLWPAALAPELDAFLASGGRALYGFAEHVGARKVRFDPPLANVNTPGDLPGAH